MKRRVWHKIHIAINEQTVEIRAADLTTRDVGDAPMLPERFDQKVPLRPRPWMAMQHMTPEPARGILIFAGYLCGRQFDNPCHRENTLRIAGRLLCGKFGPQIGQNLPGDMRFGFRRRLSWRSGQIGLPVKAVEPPAAMGTSENCVCHGADDRRE